MAIVCDLSFTYNGDYTQIEGLLTANGFTKTVINGYEHKFTNTLNSHYIKADINSPNFLFYINTWGDGVNTRHMISGESYKLIAIATEKSLFFTIIGAMASGQESNSEKLILASPLIVNNVESNYYSVTKQSIHFRNGGINTKLYSADLTGEVSIAPAATNKCFINQYLLYPYGMIENFYTVAKAVEVYHIRTLATITAYNIYVINGENYFALTPNTLLKLTDNI